MRSFRCGVIVVVALIASAGALQAADPQPSSRLSWADALQAKPPGNVVPPPPDPDVILQGGDTCATATVISALPFTADGTTAGYTNDYDEVCPYTGSTSPDVVYAFTPAADMAIDVSLCVGTTNYDTKMYIYEGTCPSAATACNDDDCSAPLYPSTFISSLTNVPLTGGQTYYIVVDGYGGESGPYTIEVTEWQPPPPPPECIGGPALLYYQTPHGPDDPWNAFTSGDTPSSNYTVYDNFTSDLFSITDLHWWGLSLFWNGAGWDPCDPAGMTFDVTFHPDSAGEPGTAVCTYAGLAPTPVNTGLSYAGYNFYYWEVTGLSPACEPTGASWVGIHSYPNPAGCALLWMSGIGGDGNMLQYDSSTSLYTPNPYDMGLCITGTVIPVELQSFGVE